jgi:hypothetical protein
MATQTIEFRAAPGLTLTAELFAIGSDTIVATASATEQTNRAGTYRAAFTNIAADEYQLVAFSGTTPVASWLVTLTLETATFQVYDRATSVNFIAPDNTAIQAIDNRLPANPAAVSDVAPTINFSPTIEPTELSAGSVTAIQSGLALEATLTEIKGSTFTEATDALDAIRAAVDAVEGGGGSVNVLPAVGIVADRSPGATIQPVVGETISQSITLYATDGTTPINLSGKTLAIVFETLQGVDVATVDNDQIAVSGTSNNVVTFAYPGAVTASERTLRFAIRDAAAPLTLYLQGLCIVTRAPQVD